MFFHIWPYVYVCLCVCENIIASPVVYGSALFWDHKGLILSNQTETIYFISTYQLDLLSDVIKHKRDVGNGILSTQRKKLIHQVIRLQWNIWDLQCNPSLITVIKIHSEKIAKAFCSMYKMLHQQRPAFRVFKLVKDQCAGDFFLGTNCV